MRSRIVVGDGDRGRVPPNMEKFGKFEIIWALFCQFNADFQVKTFYRDTLLFRLEKP